MEELFREKAKVFWSGSIVGWLAGAKFLFAGPHTWGDIVIEYTAKFVATCIFAFASGIFTVFAHDAYKEWIKPKFFKKKNKKQNL